MYSQSTHNQSPGNPLPTQSGEKLQGTKAHEVMGKIYNTRYNPRLASNNGPMIHKKCCNTVIFLDRWSLYAVDLMNKNSRCQEKQVVFTDSSYPSPDNLTCASRYSGTTSVTFAILTQQQGTHRQSNMATVTKEVPVVLP